MTIASKKTLRLLLCDYQRTARYYTIYRTFKHWSYDNFTTILRLLLASISYRAKARKEKRREPPMVPRRRARKKAQCQANARLTRCQANARSGKHRDPAGLAWSAVCCTVWHGSIAGMFHYIPYYNTRSVLTCTVSGVAVVSGIGAGRPVAVIRSSVAQVVL